jgi:hypothetical protein
MPVVVAMAMDMVARALPACQRSGRRRRRRTVVRSEQGWWGVRLNGTAMAAASARGQ